MLEFFKQIFSVITSIVAGLIISMGIVKTTPITEYQPPTDRVEKREAQKIIPVPTSGTALKPIVTPTLKPTLVPTLPSASPSAKPTGVSTPIPSPAKPTISPIEMNKKARASIVNIICTTKSGGAFRPISGSGVIISENGIILTTAHLAQYFLLENAVEAGYLDCAIRNGDVAEPAYDAKLVYIPPKWIEQNAENIIRDEAKGTGENDYAFLLINKSMVSGKELPAIFLFGVPDFDFENLPAELSVLLAAYPAGFIGGISIQKDLGLTSTFATVKNLYTFSEEESNNLDIFSLSGNIVAQSGSSGGGVFDTRDGKMLGIIVTSSEATTTGNRILNAITLPYAKRDFEKSAGEKLTAFLANPDSFPAIFPESEFNRLKKLLIEQLNKI